ncbi:MAG: methyltransferase domain-containing protein [Sulfurimonas sp.]|jgi:hypothetical protein
MTFLHDAEYRTESWQRRHSPEAIAQLGVWRWNGIQDNAARILDIICGKRVIDFGGADGPLGFGSIVVDEKADHKTLDDIDGPIDVIFTSHTLEHLNNPAHWICETRSKLNKGGYLIVHVPSWTCQRWHKDAYVNPKQKNGHKHTLSLLPAAGDEVTKGVLDWFRGWAIELAEYVGDDSILVIARKP